MAESTLEDQVSSDPLTLGHNQQFALRANDMVSEVRIRSWALASESHGAYDRMRTLLTGMLLPISLLCADGRRRDQEVCNSGKEVWKEARPPLPTHLVNLVRASNGLHTIRSRGGSMAMHSPAPAWIQVYTPVEL